MISACRVSTELTNMKYLQVAMACCTQLHCSSSVCNCEKTTNMWSHVVRHNCLKSHNSRNIFTQAALPYLCSWRTTHPVALKSIAKVPNQKVTRRPKCFSFFFFFFFFFFRRASSNLRDSFTGFRTKQQHFSLSSAPAHRFFPVLKSHKAIRTAHGRTMASFTTPFFLHVYACAQIT